MRAYRFIILSCKVAILRDFIAKSFLHFEPTIFLCTCILLSSIPYHSSQKKIIRMIRLLFTRSKISIYLISRDRIILSLNLYNFSLRIYYHTFFHSLPLIIEKKNARGIFRIRIRIPYSNCENVKNSLARTFHSSLSLSQKKSQQ